MRLRPAKIEVVRARSVDTAGNSDEPASEHLLNCANISDEP
jgi:hypothetical protein